MSELGVCFEEGCFSWVLKDRQEAVERGKGIYTAGAEHKVGVMAVSCIFLWGFGYIGAYIYQNSFNFFFF